MPNTQTSVPAFTSGQVLTAAQMTEVNTGIPVFATTTTRDAAFGGTGEKTLAEGQFAYIEASNATQYYDGAAWQTVGGGLTLVKTQTIGTTVSSVTVSDVFSATYDNYLISISGGVSSTDNYFNLTLGATATGYYRFYFEGKYNATTVTGSNAQNATSIVEVAYGSTSGMNGIIEIISPFDTKRTGIYSKSAANSTARSFILLGGYLDNATSYTAFTLTTNTGTVTGGTIRVYGYQNS